jgi:predicted DNA-binding transcriptional regulator AlpA
MPTDDVRADAPRKMLLIDDVLRIVPISASTLYRLEFEGRFPVGLAISGKTKAWFEDDIVQWQRDLVPRRRQKKS